ERRAPGASQVRIWNNTWIPSETYPVYAVNDIRDGEGNLVYPAVPFEVRQDPANYVGFQTIDVPLTNTDLMEFRDRPYSNGRLGRNEIESLAFIWQAFLFDGHVVPMIGWRKDEDTFRSAGASLETDGVFYLDEVPQWRLPQHEGDLWLAGQTNPTLE